MFHKTMGNTWEPMAPNSEYNTKGMMKGTSGAPESPFNSQVIRMLNTEKSYLNVTKEQ